MTYVALDIETTGLNPKYDKIIEIGAARVVDGTVCDTFSTFVNPGKGLPARIVELTGIHDSDVAAAPYMDGILDEFLAFAGDGVLLGHNLIFDYSFIKKAAVNQKKTFDRSGIDTLRIARRFLNDLESRALGALCEHYHISFEAHRALNDALAAHELYQALVREYGAREEEPFCPKPLIYSVKKESPVTPRQLSYLQGLAGRFNLQCDGWILLPAAGVTDEPVDLEQISKNEASRLIDRLLSTFGR